MSATVTKPELVISRDPAALAVEAAERIIAAARAAIADRGRFTLVLSGGSTPQPAYELLAQPDRRPRVDWARTWLLFGDERCVPHDDPRSNYCMLARTLLDPAQIAPDHVLAIQTDHGSPAQCAAEYEARLRAFMKVQPGDDFPQFDLVLLGLGDDGHTASLFPGMPALDEAKAWVTWTRPGVLPPPVDRVTLTFPVINSARQVIFLVSGTGKATIVRAVLEGPRDVEKHPATGVQPRDGRLTWLLDEPAAAMLSRGSTELAEVKRTETRPLTTDH